MKRLLAVLGLCAVVPLAACSVAESASAPTATPTVARAHDPMRGFTRLDANTDGRVSIDEFRAGNLRWMERVIARHPDGKLAKVSVEQREAMIVRKFERIDTNKDGMIDTAEWAARPHHRHHHHHHHRTNA